MAIAIAGSVGTIADLATVTGTYTFSNGANRALVVSAGAHQQTIGTVTLNGTNLTKIVQGTTQFNEQINLWFYNSPPAGAAGTIVTKADGASGVGFVAAEFTGVKQVGEPAGSIGVNLNSGAAPIGTLTTTTANNWNIGAFYAEDVWTAEGTTSGQTGIIHQNAQSFEAMAMSYQTIAAAGAGTMSWTISSGQRWAVAILTLEPALGVGTNLIQSSGTAVLGIGSTSTSWGVNTTSGNLIVVGVSLTNAAVLGTVTSITDSQSNTYIKAASGTLSSIGDVLDTELWYAKNITGGAGSVTVNHTIDNCSMFSREYSGFNTLDVVGSAAGSSSAPNSGTQTTSNTTELIIIATGDDKGPTQTWTAAGNYGDMVGTATTITGLSMEDLITTSSGAQTGTLTLGSTANWDALMASFYFVSTAGAVVYKSLTGAGNA